MLDWEARMEIQDLHKQGYSMRQVARLTGHSRNTVKRVLHPVEKRNAKRGRKSKLAPFADYLRERYLATELSGVRLCEEIQQMGYTGAVDAVQRFLQQLDVPRRAMERATVRYETAPGEQAQVDWADVGSFLDENGKRRKVYAFVMILSFSRMLYVEFTTSMKLEQLLGCHQRAFEYFGGFPRRILYDNMKQVRLSPGEWNPLMQDFLRHYNIAPTTCRPYRPRTKGKVERAIRYLKDNFLKGRQFADLSDLQAQAFHWQTEAANCRIHQTTGRQPVELLTAEQLIPLAAVPAYRLTQSYPRTVDAEGFVRLAGSRYSVPPLAVGQKVIVELGEQRVRVRLGAVIIADHVPSTRSGTCVAHPAHVAEMWRLAMARTPLQSKAESHLLFEQTVTARPLSVYEEAAQ